MQFEYRYFGSSAVQTRAGETGMSFAPDTRRETTHFTGELAKPIAFREAMSALHDVVISDLRYQPKDRTAYLAWRAQQEDVDWAEVARQQSRVDGRLGDVTDELNALRKNAYAVRRAFYQARTKYFNWIYNRDYTAWLVLDPVITIHPDEVFFECFSRDESSYGRLACSYEVFHKVGEFACGTTNVDYSDKLYAEFQRIRGYKRTKLQVDPAGFDVSTQGADDYREVKIDLPDSWVRGFLQVSSAMSISGVCFDLHPMDVFNLCFMLRRHKEQEGPRSFRFVLEPGEPVKIVVEPWNTEIVCPRSIFEGDEDHEIRVWGRRRLHILERLIAVASKFTVTLLGTGMPSFWVADLGELSFTLGLSGWTANDWSRAGNFDLLAPRADVDANTALGVFEALRQTWFATADELATKMGLDRAVVLGALAGWTQAGRVMFDLQKGVYRVRELSQDPLPMERLRFSSEREAKANALVAENKVIVHARRDPSGLLHLRGKVGREEPTCIIDADEQLSHGTCSCSYYIRNKLFRGPCEHLLALRIAHGRSLGGGA